MPQTFEMDAHFHGHDGALVSALEYPDKGSAD